MSTISSSTTSTTAYKVTADTTGTLVFQTGATPTTALTIDASQAVTFAGTQTYTGSSTFSSSISVQGITVGRGAGAVATNTAVGASALAANTTGNFNAAGGYQALILNVGGQYNTAFGAVSLAANAGGTDNSAFGTGALNANTSGSYNTGLGRSALQSNTTASNNTAVGYQAGYTNVTGADCTFIGRQAGYLSTGTRNTFIGAGTGYSTTGTYNTFVGTISAAGGACGEAVTTGTKNTILGGYNGNQGGLNITTASNHIVLSDGDGNPRAYADDSGNFYITASGGRLIINRSGGSSFRAVGVYNETAGTANVSIDASGNFTRATSSLKYKKNVQDATFGLSDLLNLRPVTYQGKNPSEEGITYGGLIAEEVDAIGLSQFVEYAVDGSPDALRYGNMVSLCIKAIQELKAEVDSLKAQINGASA